MSKASIPVDLFNPGQVFACIGLMEIADLAFGHAHAAFDWQRDGNCLFHLSADGDNDPIRAALECLSTAKVSSLSPESIDLGTEKWGVPTRQLPPATPFQIFPPKSPATLPARLLCETDHGIVQIDIDHWGDATVRDNVKFWAGSGGYPGAGLLRDALDLVRDQLGDALSDPFSLSCPQSSSFRLDWRRDYVPLDAGFSPNVHGNVVMVGYPVVEILAAIGLTHARPRRAERTKLEYTYSVPGAPEPTTLYDPALIRAALGGADLGLPHRDFRMQLEWPGQENQARCITNVIEETKE